MQYKENVRIKRCGSTNGDIFGRIDLQHVANPKSVIVSIGDTRIYPKRFNSFGNPIFTSEVCDFFDWTEQSLKRLHGKDFKLTALVTYESAKLNIDKNAVDSLDGVKNAIKDLDSFNKLLKDRRIYNEYLGKGKLKRFIVFGRYILDEYGQVWTINEEYEVPGMPIACTPTEFYMTYSKITHDKFASFATFEAGIAIPSKDDSCPWCTKNFTIDEMKKERFSTINGKVAHNECKKQYEHELEIDKIINNLMEYIYDDDLTFDLIPNGYCNRICCAHKPWFLCHTPDGDIEIGWRKNVISIEWKDNFKPFDMNIFDSEDVTKWNRGIHASNNKKAYEYLKKVKDFVNKNS